MKAQLAVLLVVAVVACSSRPATSPADADALPAPDGSGPFSPDAGDGGVPVSPDAGDAGAPLPPDAGSPLSVQISASVLAGPVPLLVSFEAQAQNSRGRTFYVWDFDVSDGLGIDKVGRKVDFVFSDARRFTVTLRAMDESGNAATAAVGIDGDAGQFELLTDPSVRGLSGTANRAPIMVHLDAGCPCSAVAPCVIEGLEIGPFDGSAIVIEQCDHVIVRRNFIHDISFAIADAGIPSCGRAAGGLPIRIAESNYVRVTENIVKNSQFGIVVDKMVERDGGANYLVGNRVDHNVVDNTNISFPLHGGIWLMWQEGILVDNNQVTRTGGPLDWDSRTIGVQFEACKNVVARANLIDTSTSDSLSSFVSIDRAGTCPRQGIWVVTPGYGIEFAGNTLRRGGEQGVWFLDVFGGSVHHNVILNACNSSIAFEFGAHDVAVYNNIVVARPEGPGCANPAVGDTGALIGLASSTGIRVFNNTLLHDARRTGIALDDAIPDAGWAVGPYSLPYVSSDTIDVRNNLLVGPTDGCFGSRLDPSKWQREYDVCISDAGDLLDVGAGFFSLRQDSIYQGTGDPRPEYNDPDGGRNTPGAFGGPYGDVWSE